MSAVPRVIVGRAGSLQARSKFRNVRTVVEGRTFDSKREAHRYQQLQLLERNGEVRAIRCQVPYQLRVNGIFICRYYADFVYEEMRNSEWREVVEDVKGYRTPLYQLKKKLLQACYGIEVRET